MNFGKIFAVLAAFAAVKIFSGKSDREKAYEIYKKIQPGTTYYIDKKVVMFLDSFERWQSLNVGEMDMELTKNIEDHGYTAQIIYGGIDKELQEITKYLFRDAGFNTISEIETDLSFATYIAEMEQYWKPENIPTDGLF